MNASYRFLNNAVYTKFWTPSNNPPFTPPKTYYSIEEALKEPEKVKTMFLVEIGDSLSPAIGKLTHPLPASLG
jgi:hypothetical protein